MTQTPTPTPQQDRPWTWKATIAPGPTEVETDGRQPDNSAQERLRGLTQLPDC